MVYIMTCPWAGCVVYSMTFPWADCGVQYDLSLAGCVVYSMTCPWAGCGVQYDLFLGRLCFTVLPVSGEVVVYSMNSDSHWVGCGVLYSMTWPEILYCTVCTLYSLYSYSLYWSLKMGSYCGLSGQNPPQSYIEGD